MFERFSRDITKRSSDEANELPRARALPAHSAFSEEALQAQTSLKVRLHEKLLGILNLSILDKISRDDLRREVLPVVRELVSEEGIALNSQESAKLVEEVLDEVLGLGPLEPLLKDTSVSDILVNTHRLVYVERFGKLEKTAVRFKDDRHLSRVIQKIVSGVGRRVDESQPWVDARLADGSRVNALVPPCAVDGPLLSIRKFAKTPFTIESLIENGSITTKIAAVFDLIVRSRLNVIVSGGTGSGKTTLLNALSSFVSNRERIITIEDTAELQLQQEHVGRMETRSSNIEGEGEVSQRDLLRNALRMRPDRIIVGEVRGAEVLDMLQAMNTGHDGSMTTVHANAPRDALTRLEHMIGMTGIEIPTKALRSQIASAIHVVIQIQRLSDGRRRVVSIQEIVGTEADIVTMQEIFRFERQGLDANGNVLGEHKATGVRPRFAKRGEEWGIQIPPDLFTTS